MSTAGQPAKAATVASARGYRKGSVLAGWLSSTSHKVTGHRYLITSPGFVLTAGLMAMITRARLPGPDSHLVSGQQHNELFTMHGTILPLLSATPLLAGFASATTPLRIGAPDVAFPRLNLLSDCLFVLGRLIVLASFLTPGGAPPSGWYAYSPPTSATHSPGTGAGMWTTGLALSGPGTILAGVNLVTTIMSRRAPGMTIFPMPIFTGTAANYAAFYHSRILAKVKVVRPRQIQAYAVAHQAVQKSSGSTQ